MNEKTGEIKNFPQSTTVITTSQFMDYIASIQRFAAEFLGCIVPNPGEDLTLPLDEM